MQIRGLTKYYGDKTAVDNVSFDIPKGCITAFIGPNGAGKSTVLNMITGFLPKDAGHVFIDNEDLSRLDKKQRSRTMAVLSQSNHIQSKITVRELISFGRFPHCGSRLGAEDETLVDEALDFIELKDQEHSFLDSLSGGQRQRALIAMVLCQDTDYIFLDEPTNNLDIYHATRLMSTLRDLCDKKGKTIVMVIHELNYASFYADYIATFKEGQLMRFDTSKNTIEKDFLKSIYNVDFTISHINDKPLCIHF